MRLKLNLILFIGLLSTFWVLELSAQIPMSKERQKELAKEYMDQFAKELVKILRKRKNYPKYTFGRVVINSTTYDEVEYRLRAQTTIEWTGYSDEERKNENKFTTEGLLKIVLDQKRFYYEGECTSFSGDISLSGFKNSISRVNIYDLDLEAAGQNPKFETTIKRKPKPNGSSAGQSNDKPSDNNGKNLRIVQMPDFPWPPPSASAQEEVPRSFIEAKTLYEVDIILSTALEKSGYLEHSYFQVPNGFALVTRIEQINSDASPKEDPTRWELSGDQSDAFSLKDYIRALFTAPEGYFRVLVFIVTDQGFVQSEESVNRAQTMHWLKKGYNRLPSSFKAKSFTEDHACSALIYEFSKQGNSDPIFANPSIHQGRTHLIKSNLWHFLQQ
ncbi:MAG: hypothetical protein AAFP19_04450 [Bacteroidota bacterium]